VQLKVVSKALTAFPTTINSVRNLIKVFTMIDEQCVICEGNPDAKFKPLALAKGGVFTNMKGIIMHKYTRKHVASLYLSRH
jgi:hypothetical protein